MYAHDFVHCDLHALDILIIPVFELAPNDLLEHADIAIDLRLPFRLPGVSGAGEYCPEDPFNVVVTTDVWRCREEPAGRVAGVAGRGKAFGEE